MLSPFWKPNLLPACPPWKETMSWRKGCFWSALKTRWMVAAGREKRKKQSRLSGVEGRMHQNCGLAFSRYKLAICSDGTGKGPPPPSEHLSRSLQAIQEMLTEHYACGTRSCITGQRWFSQVTPDLSQAGRASLYSQSPWLSESHW